MLGNGCPTCNLKEKYTNSIVDLKLAGRNIARINNIVNSKTKIFWKCNICTHVWSATPDSVIYSQTGCAACSHRKPITHQEIDNIVHARNIIRLENPVNVDTSIKWKCQSCTYEWVTTPNNVMYKKSGCPKCANKAPVTNNDVDIALLSRNIKRMDNVQGMLRCYRWGCLVCNHSWKTTADSVINNETGCPKCIKRISKPEEQWLDFVKVPNDTEHRQVLIRINSKNYKVDGYIPETKTVYEFWGDYWHGNPNKFDQNIRHPIAKITYGEMFNKTQQKRSAILNNGYNLIEIWESDWKQRIDF